MGAFWIAKDAKFLHADNEDCENALADLSLRWAHMSEGTFSHVAAHVHPTDYLLIWLKGAGK